MHNDSMSNRKEHRSPLGLAMGLLGAGLGLALWFRSGQLWALFGGLGFMAWAPAWYRLPLSLTQPLKFPPDVAQATAFPKWAQALTVVGMILVGISMWLRWVA